jgi:uncharacterized membrane protein YgaE (UPF0421/DUF939 family)
LIFNISQKDFILIVIGAVISFIFSWLFYKLPFQQIATYYDDENEIAFFEYKNGFNIRKFYKRPINMAYKTKISKKDFKKIKKLSKKSN